MKLRARIDKLQAEAMSLPVRGAWVEIGGRLALRVVLISSLPVRGAWVEIKTARLCIKTVYSRSPCGERGLKCVLEV